MCSLFKGGSFLEVVIKFDCYADIFVRCAFLRRASSTGSDLDSDLGGRWFCMDTRVTGSTSDIKSRLRGNGGW